MGKVKGRRRRNRRGRGRGKKARKHLNRRNRAGYEMVKFYHTKMPFPPTYKCKFRLTFNVVFQAGVGTTPNDTAIYMNALYKPILATTGTTQLGTAPFDLADGYTVNLQPQGLSNLVNTLTAGSGVYQYYRVNGFKIKVNALPVTLLDNIDLCLCPYVSTQKPSGLAQAQGDRFSVTKFFSAGADNRPLKKYISLPHFFGVSNRCYNDDVSNQFSSTGNSEPSQRAYMGLWIETSGGASLTDNLTMKFEIDYYATLYVEASKLELTS